MQFIRHASIVVRRTTLILVAGFSLFATLAPLHADEADILALQQDAVRLAADRIAPSVVQIETLGGLEKVDRMLVGTGPTTGLIVSSDGYLVSSAFNFIQQPSSILVTLPDGERRAASIVARDRSRMLVLLKVEVDSEQVVPAAAPTDSVEIGETAIAIGKTFSSADVNLSVGIVSATNRIWSKAIQTDAKISPANYGGPLIDLEGRVLGVLVPLSPEAESEVAGAEWYDSGIGFAVPLVDILKQLPRWKSGEDLVTGKLGVAIKNPEALDPPAEVGVVKARSPAAEAGLKPDDKIVQIDGVPIERLSHLRHAMQPRYAGDPITMTVRRGEETFERTIELVAEIPPYEHAFLGILPDDTVSPTGEGAGNSEKRDADSEEPGDAADAAQAPAGISIRFVFDGSPAQQAGMIAGDRIVEFHGNPVQDIAQFRLALANLEPGSTVTIRWQRDEVPQSADVVLAKLPTEVPKTMPAPLPLDPPTNRTTGIEKIEIAAETNACPIYVPDAVNRLHSPGLLVMLLPPGKIEVDALLEKWKPVCEQHNLVIIVPRPLSEERWMPTEADFVRKAMDQAIDRYAIDRQRIAVLGSGAGGAMAGLVTIRHREIVRGLALHDVAVPGLRSSLENEPLQRLAALLLVPQLADSSVGMQEDAKGLKALGFPVTEIRAPSEFDSLGEMELGTLGRWLETLGRL
jgi:serine protease Do